MKRVLDQDDDTEVAPMTKEEYNMRMKEWVATVNDGEGPLPEQEATLDQITALDARVASGATPFVDFGIWRPYGMRLGRALRFLTHVPMPDGTFQTKELNGPPTFEDWDRCFNVFVFAMEFLKLASRRAIPLPVV